MRFKTKKIKDAELIMGIEMLPKSALDELSNGLEEDEELIVGAYGDAVVGATNDIFSPLCDVIIKSPNYNPRSSAAQYGVKNNKIDTITIHHMAGNLTVETCGNIFANPNRKGSSNYGIGTDGRCAGYVGEENRAWTSSSKINDFRAITIEVANNTLAPTWTVSDKAFVTLCNLVTDVCRRNGISKLVYSENKDDRVNHRNACNITWHSDFAPTACAGPYLKNTTVITNLCNIVNANLANDPAPTPQPTPVPVTNPYTKPTTPVNSGSKGESVKWIQWQLNTYNYGLAVDGSYGPATTRAVKDFQSKKGLPVTGNCDMNTINVLDGGQPQPQPVTPDGTPDPYADYSKAIWDFFRTLGMPEFGVAGLIGNLACESGLRPNNLQNSFEKSLGMTDVQYTAAVDNGTYKNFVNDGAGYGLAQWTYPTRKQALLDFAKQCKMSICDINLQLTYLTQELQTKYKGVWDGLFAAKSVAEASNIVLLQFERPKDQSVTNQQKRATCCQGYYDKFHGTAITTTFPIKATVMKTSRPVNTVEEYNVKIMPLLLNVRNDADITAPVLTTVKKNAICTISAEKNGWGFVAAKNGWIDLRYIKRA